MAEAVEICKLRLFLKLVAQVETADQLEPLPDIDFNIRAGNTLVGFATIGEVKKTMAGTLAFGKEEVEQIVEDAEIVARAFQVFHTMQTQHGMESRSFSVAKQDLRQRLGTLVQRLDRYLAGDYGIDSDKKPKELVKWRASHEPFHWLAEFFGIMSAGGFDVIIGNPPYVEYSKVRKTYEVLRFQTESCGNLYAMCIERAYQTLSEAGRFGFIVQAPVVSTQRMSAVRSVLQSASRLLLLSTFDDRPSKLFDGMHHCRLAIILTNPKTSVIY
jgi:hypothetical protein